MASLTESTTARAQRRKEIFGDCALVEIIHLHDCLRGAIKALQHDVNALSQSIHQGSDCRVADLERCVTGRFKVIWSVFRAHSSAEDEFIWPALRSKTGAGGSPRVQSQSTPHKIPPEVDIAEQQDGDADASVDQEEYEEDHADEERMFSKMDDLLTDLHKKLVTEASSASVHEMVHAIDDLAQSLSKHLMTHLDKEETQCMPLVVKHLNKEEINDLVGKIMGKRSSDTIALIMTMAVQNLNEADRNEMVKYMKQAMVGTFFERWLAMSGWMASKATEAASMPARKNGADDQKMGRVGAATSSKRPAEVPSDSQMKRFKSEREADATAPPAIVCLGGEITKTCSTCEAQGACVAASPSPTQDGGITSQAELEKLIRAIASNPELDPVHKQTTIQGLRDSVWKSNQRYQNDSMKKLQAAVAMPPVWGMALGSNSANLPAVSVSTNATRSRRVTPASSYYRKNCDGKVELVWSSDSPSSTFPPGDKAIPLFSVAELAPTYHDGATGAVLGCPHYARACKLRHPSSGRLYTCRLCCAQEREMPTKDQDSPLDRYAVTEVLCMRCGALQPAGDRCVNDKCESNGKPFAKYSCGICNLHDDGPNKNIYHCPFCNVCRHGQGLGIDYRHCMRCNACVSLADDEHHCIPQKLQGSCPICHESMFESTEPLRGLKCGHVMHLSCYSMYIRGQNFTCPLCKKCMEDMTDYFAQLDSAIRMQPMPTAYMSTVSNIYCQDCGNTGQVQYHFVGCKCPHCGSYNTRELKRVQNTNKTGDS